jgi:hypothetical protein
LLANSRLELKSLLRTSPLAYFSAASAMRSQRFCQIGACLTDNFLYNFKAEMPFRLFSFLFHCPETYDQSHRTLRKVRFGLNKLDRWTPNISGRASKLVPNQGEHLTELHSIIRLLSVLEKFRLSAKMFFAVKRSSLLQKRFIRSLPFFHYRIKTTQTVFL